MPVLFHALTVTDVVVTPVTVAMHGVDTADGVATTTGTKPRLWFHTTEPPAPVVTTAKAATPAPVAPTGPAAPVGPAAPAGPAAPVAPVGPAAPVAPAGPTGPAGPVTPCGPGSPTGPAAPAGPTAPAGPAAPSGPAGPAGPGTGGRAASSTTPSLRRDVDRAARRLSRKIPPSGLPGSRRPGLLRLAITQSPTRHHWHYCPTPRPERGSAPAPECHQCRRPRSPEAP